MKISSVQSDLIYQLQLSLEIEHYYLHIFEIIFLFDWRIYNSIVLIEQMIVVELSYR